MAEIWNSSKVSYFEKKKNKKTFRPSIGPSLLNTSREQGSFTCSSKLLILTYNSMCSPHNRWDNGASAAVKLLKILLFWKEFIGKHVLSITPNNKRFKQNKIILNGQVHAHAIEVCGLFKDEIMY